MVLQIGRGEGNLFLPLLGNGQAIPQHIDPFPTQLCLFGVPVNGFELNFGTQALCRFAGKIAEAEASAIEEAAGPGVESRRPTP